METKKKYNDIDTKKEGSTIETPYKYTDSRSKSKVADISSDNKTLSSDEEALLKED